MLEQCLLGIQCDDFVMIASDQTKTQGICVYKDDEEKIFQLTDSLMMGVNGDNGDTAQFSQFLTRNLQLYRIRNRYQLGVAAAVHFARRSLAEGLRGAAGKAYAVNLLLGGFDLEQGGQLYFVDHLASCVRVPIAAHGLGGMLAFSILDKNHKPTLTEQEGYELLQTAVHEVQQRLFINLRKFQVSVVDKEGIKRLPAICKVAETTLQF